MASSHRERLLPSQRLPQIATRYDRLARNYLAAVYLIAAIVWWI
jgi:hypothetical protein